MHGAAASIEAVAWPGRAISDRDARDRFLNIASASPDAILCANEAGHITFWNPAAQRIFGYPPEVATRSRQDIILPDETLQEYEDWLLTVRDRPPGARFSDHIELTCRRADGSLFPGEMTYASWYESGDFVICSLVRDLTPRRQAEERLRDLATRDGLTGLANRAACLEQLRLVGSANQKDESSRAALLLVGLDRFRDINDTLDHDTGDRVLRHIGRRLALFHSGNIHVARLGGDEFTLVQRGGDAETGLALARRVREVVRRPIRCRGQQLEISASIGIAVAPDHAGEGNDLLANADLAAHSAKADGGNYTRVYVPRLREAATSRRETEDELRAAFRQGALELLYQPQIRIRDGAVIGAEALLRWRHPRHGLLFPASFLPVLASSTLSAAVGNWVIDVAIRQAAAWAAVARADFRMGVNLFPSQLIDGDLATTVLAALARHGLPPNRLEVEITETIALRHEAGETLPLKRLMEAGVGIAFDDFGTGYGSLSYLRRVPVTRLKIDKSFIRGMVADAGDAAIVRAVLSLGRSLGLGVIAEGIETEAQRLLLLGLGCEEGQGYLFGEPMAAGEFATLLAAGTGSRD